jgi:uncharacterized protein
LIIYEAEKSQFLIDVDNDIEDIVLESYLKRTGNAVGASEIKSWASSLVYMGRVLKDDTIPGDCGVAIEYTIPQTAKRVDFILTGRTVDRHPCAVIVELKQWQQAAATTKDAVVTTHFGGGVAEAMHPSYQAWSYAALLEGYNEAVYEGGIRLVPCAYLHNYPPPGEPITNPFYADHVNRAPVFLKGQRELLKDFIKSNVRYGDKGEVLYLIEQGRIRPSRSLADALVGLLKGQPEFVLVDDQKIVFETALQQAQKVQETGKRVLIVEGGPGTGKSVVAMNLLVALTDSRLTARYVTKNAAPRAVYESKLTGTFKKSHISNLFTGSGSFTQSAENEWDALVIDEAHRLNEKSGLYGNLGENQVKELIRASRFSVFFIDESQRVTLRDAGTKAEIRKWARQFGARVTETGLASQFRCNGSDGYLAWLDHNLQIRTTANETLDTAEFDFRILDSPAALRDLIFEKNLERNRARMVAGYCWKWPSKTNPKAFDIELPEHDFKARWNLTKDGSLWMVSPDSVQEVGCIHTCQGLEVDYVGVIVGDDLVVRNGKVLSRPEKRASSDKSVHGLKALAKQDAREAARRADEIIKNTYRTLMTRGMKGCYVYFTDAQTAAFFRSRLRTSVNAHESRSLTPMVGSDIGDLRPFRIVPASDAIPFQTALPVIPLKLAAGSFSGTQSNDPDGVEWAIPDGVAMGPGMFIAQVVGESMNRRIPNGAWCVFRANPAGTRQHKIVLAQHRDIADPETGGSFTVKVYSSEKSADPESGWKHVAVTLSPSSTDPRFQPIIVRQSEEHPVTIIAELIAVLA